MNAVRKSLSIHLWQQHKQVKTTEFFAGMQLKNPMQLGIWTQ